MLDLLIAGGQIVDGSGNVGFRGGVGVEGESVRILRGDLSDVAAPRVIDATDRVVCPGFIDFHAHSGLMILAEPHHAPKVHQGVTTEVIGVDGNSYAPFRSQADLGRFIQLNSGLDGNPPIRADWSSVEQYLDRFDQQVAVNICYLVGNSPLRIAAVGWDQRPATAAEQADMRAVLREAMEEGAWGLSTGLDYPPGSYADTDELVGLAEEAARLGGIYHSHVRYRLGDRFLDPFREAIEIGRRSGIPAHITHFYQRLNTPGSASDMLALVEAARDQEGLDVTFDSYPYVYSSTRLLIMFPDWAHDGGPEHLLAALRSPEARERLRREVAPRGQSWQDIWLTYFKQPHNHLYEGCSVTEVAAMRNQHPVDALCDLLVEEDLQVSYIALSGDATSLPRFLAHPLSMVGSDAVLLGEFPSPRTYGCFPIILGKFARDEGALSLPAAIRKMTSFPAQRLGLANRGLLRDGFKADVVVFDPARVGAPATRSQPRQLAVGIDYVLVNGQLVIDAGQPTGALPGRALRRGRPGSAAVTSVVGDSTPPGPARPAPAQRLSSTLVRDSGRPPTMSEHPHSEHKPPHHTPSSFGVVYPENDIVAVLTDRAAAERAIEALRAAGISTDDVDLASGDQVLEFERERQQRQNPTLVKIGRAVASALSEDVRFHERLLEEARAGRQFVVVHAPQAQVVDQARPILLEHQPRLVLDYRKGSIEELG